MLIHAAQLVGQGASLRAACQMAVIAPLSDDEELLQALAAALDAVA
jgi:nitric oxide reductase NorQ protein